MSYNNNYTYNNNAYNNNKGGYNNNNYNKQSGNGNEKSAKVGSIWRGTTKTGAEYLSIIIGNKKYVAFLNNYKNAPNQPDFNILESNSNAGNNNNQATTQNGYNNQNGNYVKKAYVPQNNINKEQNNVDAYYAAQNMPVGMSEFKRNEFENNTVDDINVLPGNDMPVF